MLALGGTRVQMLQQRTINKSFNGTALKVRQLDALKSALIIESYDQNVHCMRGSALHQIPISSLIVKLADKATI